MHRDRETKFSTLNRLPFYDVALTEKPPSTQPGTAPVVPKTLKWHGKLAALAIYGVSRLVSCTWRCEWIDRSGIIQDTATGPVIFCTWHNRLALSMVVYHDYVRRHKPGIPLAALISASKDGALLTRALAYYNVIAVRGSSSRRGRQALLELTSYIEDNHHVAITPDGPRGPCYKIQTGIIGLAQLTGLPIIPVSNHVSWKLCMKSWDRFQIPLPFARCRITLGEPIRIPRDATEEQRESLRQDLESRMRSLTED